MAEMVENIDIQMAVDSETYDTLIHVESRSRLYRSTVAAEEIQQEAFLRACRDGRAIAGVKFKRFEDGHYDMAWRYGEAILGWAIIIRRHLALSSLGHKDEKPAK